MNTNATMNQRYYHEPFECEIQHTQTLCKIDSWADVAPFASSAKLVQVRHLHVSHLTKPLSLPWTTGSRNCLPTIGALPRAAAKLRATYHLARLFATGIYPGRGTVPAGPRRYKPR